MGKGEIALNEQFLLFPLCFQLNQINVFPFVHIFDIIYLFAVELEEPEIGISGKGLICYSSVHYFQENWSAFAPDFKELDENVEYDERESEFDIEEEGKERDDLKGNLQGIFLSLLSEYSERVVDQWNISEQFTMFFRTYSGYSK